MKSATLLLLLGLSAPAARADQPAKTEAQLHIDKASLFHKDGKFPQALDELTAAYALDPQPGLLYAIAQVHVKLGQCTLAIGFYERFIASKPDEGAASAAQEAIDSCKQAGDTAAVKPDPTPTPTPTPTPVPAGPADTVWYHDVIGDALTGGGVVVVAVSAIVFAAALGKLDDADKATTYQAHADLVDSAHGQRTMSVVLLVGGAGLIGAGVYHYIRHADPGPTQVGLVPTQGGAFATFSARF